MLTKRITKGTYVGTGEEFVIVDDYADPNCAHRILKNAWIGTTLIHEKVKPEIDEDPADVPKRDERERMAGLDSIEVKSLLSLG